MKKTILLISVALIIFSCSEETVTNENLTSESQTIEIDYSKIIDPETATPKAIYDNSAKGLYKGVFVSDDLAYHGVITVNLGNDGQYNAILVYDNQKFGFLGTINEASNVKSIIEFRGENAGFTLNVSDYTQPIVTDGYIDGKEAQLKLLKETSGFQVRAVLGSFTDDLDPLFTGAWDLLSTGPMVTLTIPTGQPGPFPPAFIDVDVNIITSVVLTKNGNMFTDNSMENFIAGAGCGTTLPPGSQAPFYTGPQTLFGFLEIDEYALANQESTFLGELAEWNLIFSKYQGDKYYNNNCIEEIGGGTWSWKGRSGHILLVP